MKTTVFLKLGLYEEEKEYKNPQSSVIFNDISKNTERLLDRNIELCLSIDDYINSHEQNIKLNGLMVNHITPNHNHDFYELNYVMEGEVYEIVGGENYIFDKGTMLIMHPSVFHASYMAKGSRGFNILIRKEYIEKLNHLFSSRCEKNPIERIAAKSSYIIFKSKNSDFFNKYILELDEKQKELSVKNGMLSVYSESLITKMLLDISCAESSGLITTEYAEVKSADTPNTILQYLKDNYKTVTLHSLSKKFGYSQSQIARIIKKYTGHTFSSYIMSARMAEATFLAINTDKTVMQISEEVGIHSPEYFCRLYKKQVGLSPLAHRKYARNEFIPK